MGETFKKHFNLMLLILFSVFMFITDSEFFSDVFKVIYLLN